MPQKSQFFRPKVNGLMACSTRLSKSFDNLVENAIMPLALGRKNFLFCGNHDTAVRAAIVYSLVDSCKALDVDPREWMEDILLRIPGNENNREALRELLPDKWAKQTN